MTVFRKCTENFVATLVDDEVLIVDLDGGELFSLSGTGRAIWDAVDGRRSAAEIAEILAEAHAGDKADIETDVAALLAECELAALVEPVGQAAL
ncbi:PqqD family protein [Qipengyuania vesicularis]|uniref:PqqD family protein n=1 Tax=Qipengyuania vesicularis TaxID=2867232 RepID=UPI001C87C342|nr:PqqD family protein [Qipengyuania vesicularis]MBX7528153.1 PqqD family protein [Qipengyuania vesicularis]